MQRSTSNFVFTWLVFILILPGCSKVKFNETNPTLLPLTNKNPILSSVIPNPTNWEDVEGIYPHPVYRQLPGLALEIASGESRGDVYVLGVGSEAYGHQVFTFENPSRSFNTPVNWRYISSPGGISITTSEGRPVIVDNRGRIYWYEGGKWTWFNFGNPPPASAIAIRNFYFSNDINHTDGQLYILGATNIPGGHPVYKYNYNTHVWNQVGSQGAVRITVDIYSRPWIVSNTGQIFSAGTYGANGWTPYPGLAMDISSTEVGYPNTSMVILGPPFAPNTGSVLWMPYPFMPPAKNAWYNVGGSGKRIAANMTELWVIAADNTIWRSPI